MITAPFYDEVPGDLGFEAAWLGRDVMLALLALPRHQADENRAGPRERRGPPQARPHDRAAPGASGL